MAAARLQLVVFCRYNSDAATGYVYDIVMFGAGPTPGFQPLWEIKGPTRGSMGK